MKLQESGEKTMDLVPYERGILLSEVARGTLVRFLPGSVIGMGALAAIVPRGGPGGPRSRPVQSISSGADFGVKWLSACHMAGGLPRLSFGSRLSGLAPRGTSPTLEGDERQPTEPMLFESQAHGPSPPEPES